MVVVIKTKDEIARVLKESRKKTSLSAKEVTDQLRLHGIDISPKTLYGWESGHTQPNADALLLLCDIYGFEDIMREFGYGDKVQNPTTESKTPERDEVHRKVDRLDEAKCKLVSAYIDGVTDESNERTQS